MFDEALARAKELDSHLEREGNVVGPLHGLPVSLKDSFNVKGFATTIGFVANLKEPPATHNSAIVDILLQLGAIPFVKTNIPQAMMSADSENNIFGRTLNPVRLCLTAGGSTGGEGALIKLRGSVLGVCTDVAGSARIPALCNGILGFKPSFGRIPFAGGKPLGRSGTPAAVLPVIGMASHSLRDMELLIRSVIDTEPWKLDHAVFSVPWRRVDPFQRKLKLGYIVEDFRKRPLHPPQLRMIGTLVDTLKDQGHSLLPLDEKIPSVYDTSLLAWKHFLLDPQKTVVKTLQRGGEQFVKSMAITQYPELRDWQPSLDELWDMHIQRAEVLKIYHDLVVQLDLDAILLPTYQATAVPHDTFGLTIYTVLANFLDVRSESFPLPMPMYLTNCVSTQQSQCRIFALARKKTRPFSEEMLCMSRRVSISAISFKEDFHVDNALAYNCPPAF